jgi:hypothetical protein
MILIVMYLLNLVCIYRTPRKKFVGATEDWSPKAEYASVKTVFDKSDLEIHDELKAVTDTMEMELDRLMAEFSKKMLVDA